MAEALIAAGAAVLVGGMSLVGVIISNNRINVKIQNCMTTAQAVANERIEELTREVRTHNDFATRIPVIEEKINVANYRILELERYHKSNKKEE